MFYCSAWAISPSSPSGRDIILCFRYHPLLPLDSKINIFFILLFYNAFLLNNYSDYRRMQSVFHVPQNRIRIIFGVLNPSHPYLRLFWSDLKLPPPNNNNFHLLGNHLFQGILLVRESQAFSIKNVKSQVISVITDEKFYEKI